MASDVTKTDSGADQTGSANSRRARFVRSSSFYTVKLYRDFRFLWVGNFFTVGAQWIQILTIGWLVLKLTDGNALLHRHSGRRQDTAGAAHWPLGRSVGRPGRPP